MVKQRIRKITTSTKRKFDGKQYFESKRGFTNKSIAEKYAKSVERVYHYRIVKKSDGYSVYLRTRGI